jgi:serine/threonine-protein kinase
VKVLLPEIASVTNSERFVREIQIAASLSHPQIVQLYDSGAAHGLLFYVMPYVPGPTLRDRLVGAARLPIEEAGRIVADVARALTFAHEHGVVHRDIKPENILLLGGQALVTDFGVARAIVVAAGQRITQTGMTVGTPDYMSPEQARGGELDGRTDTYSLACVTYEMAGGHPPFIAASPQEMLARHAADPVPSLRAARPDVPPAFERAVMRALAKKPADRFDTTVQFAEALNHGATPRVAPRPASDQDDGVLRRALRSFLDRSRPD